MAKLGGPPEKVAGTIADALFRAEPPEGALPGHPERAPADRPAPLHAGSGLGPDDARPVSDAEAVEP